MPLDQAVLRLADDLRRRRSAPTTEGKSAPGLDDSRDGPLDLALVGLVVLVAVGGAALLIAVSGRP